jgi:hypothetical protein
MNKTALSSPYLHDRLCKNFFIAATGRQFSFLAHCNFMATPAGGHR